MRGLISNRSRQQWSQEFDRESSRGFVSPAERMAKERHTSTRAPLLFRMSAMTRVHHLSVVNSSVPKSKRNPQDLFNRQTPSGRWPLNRPLPSNLRIYRV